MNERLGAMDNIELVACHHGLLTRDNSMRVANFSDYRTNIPPTLLVMFQKYCEQDKFADNFKLFNKLHYRVQNRLFHSINPILRAIHHGDISHGNFQAWFNFFSSCNKQEYDGFNNIIGHYTNGNPWADEVLLQLIYPQNRCLFSAGIFDQIPRHLPPEAYNQLIVVILQIAPQVTDQDLTLEQFRLHVTEIIAEAVRRNEAVQIQGGAAERFNNTQSTHVDSIEKSASASAVALNKAYSTLLNAPITPETIHMFPRFLQDSDIGQVLSNTLLIQRMKSKIAEKANPDDIEKAAIRFLTQTLSSLDYIERDSKISLKQLLALSIIAAQDDSRLVTGADTTDSLKALITGFYECQRGYNITRENKDDGDEDSMICKMGAFNKLINCMEGVHILCETKHLTHEQAILKFPRVVNQELRSLIQKLPEHEQKQLKQELAQAEGITQPVWEAIQPAVLHRINDEFGSLYQEGGNNTGPEHLEALTQSVMYIAIDPDIFKN